MYVSIYNYVRLYIYVCACVSQSLSIYICIHIHIYICVYIYICIHTYIYMYIYIYVHKYENHIFFPLNHPRYLPIQTCRWPHDHGWLCMAIWDPQSFGQRVLRFALALVDQKAKGVIIRALLERDPGRGLVDVARMLPVVGPLSVQKTPGSHLVWSSSFQTRMEK